MSHTLYIETNIHQEDNGATIRLFDISGVADGTNYPDGWSDGVNSLHNPLQSEVTQIKVTISLGDIAYEVTYTGASDIQDFMNPMVGKSFAVADVLGATYEYFEDGIYTITVEYSGLLIQGISNPWTASDEFQEAFLWKLHNQYRQLLMDIDVPIKDYVQAFKAATIEVLFTDIYYLAQFGLADKAQDVMDYLTSVLANETELTELFKTYKDY